MNQLDFFRNEPQWGQPAKEGLMFLPVDEKHAARIAVLGVGGAGGNAVNHMIEAGLRGVDFYAINTDAQALLNSRAENRIQIGSTLTSGLGSGGKPEIGRKACEESLPEIKELLDRVDMIFIAAGEGGGTGTGAAPLIAEAARAQGILTVAIVTRPFDFEGPVRRRQAEAGVEELRDKVDTLIVIPNQKLLAIVPRETTLYEAFRVADDVLLNATRGIADIITTAGLVNVDFADVRTVMSCKGHAIMGTGLGHGETRAVEAAQNAVSSPLIDDISINGAKGILLNITGGADMTLYEVNEAASVICSQTGTEANIIFGAVKDESLADGLKVTVIATGIEEPPPRIPEVFDLARGPKTDDRPTVRRVERAHPAVAVASEPAPARPFSKDDLEIPTFLRRQLD